MPAQWTAEVIGEMHLKKVSIKRLAAEMGITPEYASMIINGHRDPPGAEERFRGALKKIVEARA